MTGHRTGDFGRSAQKNGGAPEGGRQEFESMNNIVPMTGGDNADVAWLRDLLDRARTHIVSRPIRLTPAMAQALLDANPDNRKISHAVTVANYARDMTNGAWAMNGESIIVARDGFLNDGQHRCAAVVTSSSPTCS